jgi:hypothetical protein
VNEQKYFGLGFLFGALAFWGILIAGDEIIAETSIVNNTAKLKLAGKIYKVVVDSAATDSLHNWRTK